MNLNEQEFALTEIPAEIVSDVESKSGEDSRSNLGGDNSSNLKSVSAQCEPKTAPIRRKIQYRQRIGSRKERKKT
jgi:hypothetical protein